MLLFRHSRTSHLDQLLESVTHLLGFATHLDRKWCRSDGLVVILTTKQRCLVCETVSESESVTETVLNPIPSDQACPHPIKYSPYPLNVGPIPTRQSNTIKCSVYHITNAFLFQKYGIRVLEKRLNVVVGPIIYAEDNSGLHHLSKHRYTVSS